MNSKRTRRGRCRVLGGDDGDGWLGHAFTRSSEQCFTPNNFESQSRIDYAKLRPQLRSGFGGLRIFLPPPRGPFRVLIKTSNSEVVRLGDAHRQRRPLPRGCHGPHSW